MYTSHTGMVVSTICLCCPSLFLHPSLSLPSSLLLHCKKITLLISIFVLFSTKIIIHKERYIYLIKSKISLLYQVFFVLFHFKYKPHTICLLKANLFVCLIIVIVFTWFRYSLHIVQYQIFFLFLDFSEGCV